MNQLHPLSRSLLPALLIVGAWSGCSADPTSQASIPPATGAVAPGTGGATSGGSTATTGGSAANTGGAAPGGGGGTSSGATATTGGTLATGGTGSGGTSSANAGSANAGSATGGSANGGSATGGSASGGSSTGGSAAGGNASGTGGRSTSGGSAANGGSSGGKASGGSTTGGNATGGGAGASTCNLPATVGFQKDVQPFLITACGGGNGCHVVDASSTMSSGGYNHAYDWLTGGAHTSSCPSGPMRFQIVIDVINAANPASCSKSRKMPPPDATGAGLRTPLTRCQVETLQAWLNEPLVTQTHRADDSSPTTPYAMPPFN